jgi:hypothetical protein
MVLLFEALLGRQRSLRLFVSAGFVFAAGRGELIAQPSRRKCLHPVNDVLEKIQKVYRGAPALAKGYM